MMQLKSAHGNFTIISGFPGIGKTYFCNLHPQVTDSDSHAFKEYSPEVYAEHIRTLYLLHQPVLVSTHESVRERLKASDVPFLLVYPAKELKQDYIQRYMLRSGFNGGNDFAHRIKMNWDTWIDDLRSMCGVPKIELQEGQFLSDVIEVLP